MAKNLLLYLPPFDQGQLFHESGFMLYYITSNFNVIGKCYGPYVAKIANVTVLQVLGTPVPTP